MVISLKPASEVVAFDAGERLAPGERLPGPYAASAMPSRGRFEPERECPTRHPFQRDRDRVLHSTAFRRLTYKTQVFLFHEGDHFRSRLTHSLEVAQIARTVARQLRLDEDLAEALALAHDLGHPPFGHAGERALDRAMAVHGGFDHNAQSLRVVTQLERKYAAFDGLNLTWESLEGLAKHNGPVDPAKHEALAKVARRFAPWSDLQLDRWPSAEAQVAALSDDIAYLTHDVDDGLRAGLLRLEDLASVPLAGPPATEALARGGRTNDQRHIYEVTRRMITALIADLVAQSRLLLNRLTPASPDDIRAAGAATVGFSPATADGMARLKAFLFERVYRHERVMKVMSGAERVVTDLFAAYAADPARMPARWAQAAATAPDERRRARIIADFVAGQTDRYAISEHRRLFDATPELR